MLFIGKYNSLTIVRYTSVGFFLSDDEGNEVLLPNKYITPEMDLDQTIKVFVYLDSEERPVATTQTPKAIRNEFAYLEVTDVTAVGAFMDWGLEKELFVPFREQLTPMRVGEWHLVYVYLDQATQRLLATAKWQKQLDNSRLLVKEGDEVQLLIAQQTELGFTAIVNHFHKGLLYANEVFRPLAVGQQLTGYVKKVREENKLDLSLLLVGYQKIPQEAERILDLLRAKKGSLPLHDNSPAEEISKQLQMSKKTFKRAVGALYKQGLIDLREDSIQLRTSS